MMSQENREQPNRVNLYLVKPSSYDDDGYVVRYFRGVLPSNTLACLAGLTQEARRKELDGIEIDTHLIDECVMQVPVRRICRSQRSGEKTIVGLVGVQTHQFPRAADLAKCFRREGLTVMLGGFHVSGQIAMHNETPPEIQELIDLGVCIVAGEVEETWAQLLQDAIQGSLAPLYDFSRQRPSLDSSPVPRLDQGLLRRFVASSHGTIDCGRGCPFNCSFCTIINVQGRKMRFRSPETIIEAIRENYEKNGTSFYFFTDDNFARNKNWEAIFDAMIQLREEEGMPVDFMMQVDVLSYRIPGFIEKARRAGCSNVFIGMESINDENLKAAGKRQNKVDDFKNLIDAYRSAEIATHVGYIVGFPFDTPESIRRDLDRLINEIQVDMASFFILTPLPGSRDNIEMEKTGRKLDPDYNRYDSQHEALDFANFPREGDLSASYQEAWTTFYGLENLRKVLRRAPRRNYWNLFFNFIWYRSAALVEKRHPMMAGFFRLKGRTEVRDGVEPLPRFRYYWKRARELAHFFSANLLLLLEMQLLWLETRPKSNAEQRVLEEVRGLQREAARRIRAADVQRAYIRAREAVPTLRVPSRFRLFVEKWNPFSVFSAFYPSEEILEFWRYCEGQLKRGRIYRIPVRALIFRFLQDFRLSLHFAAELMRQSHTNKA